MSLIEQAARRLEQLREAGSQLSGNLEFPDADAATRRPEEEDSIIERAAQKLRALNENPAVAPRVHVPPTNEAREASQRANREASQSAATSGRADATPVAGHGQVPAPSTAAQSSPQSPSHASTHAPSHGNAPAAAVRSFETAPEPRRVEQVEGSMVRPQGRQRSREVEIDFNRILERGLLTPNSAQSRLANELRVIKRPLINNCLGKGATQVKHARRIMVTSALPGEGKSFISLNLALSIAMERDSTVLLLEGDPTRPALAEMLGIPPARGLMDLLVDPKLDVSDVLIRTNLGRLSFIPAGTRHEHATELLASTVMEHLVEQLYERYPDRILIFDSPPLLAAPEPRVLAQHMGQIVYVVEADQTSQSTVQEALSTIESCPVVMTVLNKSSYREEGYYYSYYYAQPE
jgi:protein-tyrosine kinase